MGAKSTRSSQMRNSPPRSLQRRPMPNPNIFTLVSAPTCYSTVFTLCRQNRTRNGMMATDRRALRVPVLTRVSTITAYDLPVCLSLRQYRASHPKGKHRQGWMRSDTPHPEGTEAVSRRCCRRRGCAAGASGLGTTDGRRPVSRDSRRAAPDPARTHARS